MMNAKRRCFLAKSLVALILLSVLVIVGPRSVAETGVTNAVGAGQLFNGGITNFVGATGPLNALFITNGGVATNGLGIVGATRDARSNTVVVAGTGSAWTNSGSVTVGLTGAWNQVTVSDGGSVFSAGTVFGQRNSSNNLILVSGANSVWTNAGTLAVGGITGAGSSWGNQLIVSNGGRFVTTGNTTVGQQTGPSRSTILVTGSNSLFSNGGTFTLGSGNTSAGDSLIVTNGGTFVSSGNFNVGGTTASTGHVMVVSGPGSLLNAGAALTVGSSGGGLNRMIISDGGVVISTTIGALGNAASAVSNSVVVTDPGSMWTNVAKLLVGISGSFNSLLISNGGTVTSLDALIGSGSSTNNQATITGAGSSWRSAGILYVGTNASSFGNVLLVNQGGLFEAKSLVVGVGGAITNSGGILQFSVAAPSVTNLNRIAVDGGTLGFRAVAGVDVKANWTGALTNLAFSGNNAFRLNASSNAAAGQDYVFNTGFGGTNYTRLEMINGATLWQGGSLTVGNGGSLLVSNTAAVVANAFTNRGSVQVVNSTFTLQQQLVVASNATFNLVNSTNVLNGGLLIASNAVFGGSGRVESGAGAANFGTLSPGNSPGTLVFSSNLTLGASSALEIEIGGTNAADFDHLIANGVFTLGGALNVTLINGFAPTDSVSFGILGADLFSGSFASLNLPSAGWSFAEATGILSFTAIPEPGVAPLVALAGLGAWLLRRRRGGAVRASRDGRV
jgi:T5SS/PEP-CTERM-associated repeat protein